jgi:hypothetical protein
MQRMTRFARGVAMLYIDGFRNMKVGKKLWLLIAVKLFVMFAVLKVFFFPNVLKENFSSDAERAAYILESMTAEDTATVPSGQPGSRLSKQP